MTGRDVQVTFILFTSCKKRKMWIHCFRQQLATCLMCPSPRRSELILAVSCCLQYADATTDPLTS